MKSSEYLVNAWALRVFAIEKARGLHTLDETRRKIYEMLTDEQKITFILAGGVPFLAPCQEQHIQEGRSVSDRETDQLPVLC